MKRSLKLIRNILLIVIIISIIGYTKEYRFTPVDVAKSFGEKIFLENPDIKQLSTNNKYTTFLLEEDNVLACSVIEKVFGFVYHPANFGSTFITLNNSDTDKESFTSKCSTTYERYFNVSYQDDLILGNQLEPTNHYYSYDYYSNPLIVYEVKDTFAKSFGTEEEPWDKYLDINYQEFLDNILLQKVRFYYNELTFGLSSRTNAITNQVNYRIERTNVFGNQIVYNFSFNYLINHPEELKVSEALQIENRLFELSLFDDSFRQFESIEALEALTEIQIIEILNQTLQEKNIDIDVNKVEIYGSFAIEKSDSSTPVILSDDEKNTLENYLKYNKLSSVIERNNMSYDDIKSQTLTQILSDLEINDGLIQTSDDIYTRLNSNSFMEFGPTVFTPDGNKVQAYFRMSREDEFNSIIYNRPYLNELIESIILESYTEIVAQDDIKFVAQAIHQALVNNLFVKYSSISVSIIGDVIEDNILTD